MDKRAEFQRGQTLRWLESYLALRKIVVIVGVQTSQLQGISAGVPQGSVQGPTIFSCFINDLPSIVSILTLKWVNEVEKQIISNFNKRQKQVQESQKAGKQLATSSVGVDGNHYRVNGYRVDGYRVNGYHMNAYRVNGYRVDGYRVDGYRVNGYHMNGYRVNGYHVDGYNVNGYRVHGYSLNGYKVNGYRVDGLRVNGYSVNGYKVN
eukprot:g23532.t1